MLATKDAMETWRAPAETVATAQTARRVQVPLPRLRPIAWSRTGRVAGVGTTELGDARAIAVCDVAAQRCERLPGAVAGSPPYGTIGGWLSDARRFIARTNEGIMLVDADNPKASRRLLPAGPRDSVALSRDGRTLLVERDVFDSDIWMFERK
jgi:hypothetical protein